MGGGLSFGGGRSFWSLRLALHAQPLLGLTGGGTGFMGRSDLLLGLTPYKRTFQLWFELGASVELLQGNVDGFALWDVRFGGLVGLRLGWQFHPRMLIYARPAFLVFPQAIQFEFRDIVVYTTSIWRVELALGLEFRL